MFVSDAAPLSGRARQLPVKGRIRKRGPRSSVSWLRRKCRTRAAPPGVASGSSGVDTPGSQSHVRGLPHACVSLLSANMRNLIKNNVQLAYIIEQFAPDILALQETWLTDSTKEFKIVYVSRVWTVGTVVRGERLFSL